MKLEDVAAERNPISGDKGGLLELRSWIEGTGGWIVWLGTGALGLWVVDKVISTFNGGKGGLLTEVSGFFGHLGLGGAPAAAAAASAAPAGPSFYV